MARISNAEKSKYTRLGEDADDAPCYYCQAESVMDDLTPSPKASDFDKSMFSGTWTIARTCRSCWGKIYTANVANSGIRFSVPKGCMTVEQKQEALNVRANAKSNSTAAKYMLGFDKSLAVPSDTTKIENGPYIHSGHSFFEDEIKVLQGAFLLRLFQMEEELVVMAFEAAMASGYLDVAKEAIYKEMLELP